ncbi:hypothetical protein ACOMHN_032566 [Nucella lapillus]
MGKEKEDCELQGPNFLGNWGPIKLVMQNQQFRVRVYKKGVRDKFTVTIANLREVFPDAREVSSDDGQISDAVVMFE